MPQTAVGQSGTATHAPVQYRFRVGATISSWMSADQLKEAALRGELPSDGEVQQSGHAEWVVASHVRGLAFPAPAMAEAHAAPVNDLQSVIAGSNSRQPRFATFRDLLGLFTHSDVEVNLPDSKEFSPAKLCAAGVDHFEVTLESGRSRVFVPYGRIQAIWATETSSSPTASYRESHRITIEVEPLRH